MKLPAVLKKKAKKSSGLYKILGVANKATKEEIEAAFKKVAKKSHPDLGGDKETFIQILNAYRVLRDEEKRSLYDLTGEVEENLVDNDFSLMIEGLIMLFKSVLETDIPDKLDVSLIEVMKQSVTNDIERTMKEQKKIDMELSRLNDLEMRLKRKDDRPNIFVKITSEKISNLLKLHSNEKKRERILLLALEELDNYRCLTEIVDIVHFYSFNTSSTTA